MASKVSNRIIEERDRLGWSDAELARQLKVSKSTVHDWVHGEHEPTLRSLRRLAKAFGCDVARLMGLVL